MSNGNTISVIIPALNEERNLEATVQTVLDSVNRWFDDYELIIFNDGSTDRTGEVAERLSSSIERVYAYHNSRPRCLGGVYKEGIKRARMNYVILVNGKNDKTPEGLDKIFSLRGKADIIIPFIINTYDRSIIRRFLSRTYTTIFNYIFRLNIRYYNESVLHKRSIINSINIRTNSYAFQAEALIKLIRRGHTYVEVGVVDHYEKGIKTKAFRPDNVLGVARFFLMAIWEAYFIKNES